MCLCKDTNFKANHNPLGEVISGGAVVCAYAKILILKQITTGCPLCGRISRCICLCKDTNLKANYC